ncbi:hypothetical protein LINPERHAP2_LOCUS42952 [Linum perenne]
MEVMDFQELLTRNWEVRLRHVFREENFVANFLAGRGLAYQLSIHAIPNSDVNLDFHLRYECSGVTKSHSILLNDYMMLLVTSDWTCIIHKITN